MAVGMLWSRGSASVAQHELEIEADVLDVTARAIEEEGAKVVSSSPSPHCAQPGTHCKYCATMECGNQILLSTPHRRMTKALSEPILANSRILGYALARSSTTMSRKMYMRRHMRPWCKGTAVLSSRESPHCLCRGRGSANAEGAELRD